MKQGELISVKNGPLIGLLGQPNTGKSTLFNALTGARQHVGNWPGKTVEKKEGVFKYKGKAYTLLDLPGTYSLSANSEEELVTRQNIIGNDIDLVFALVDASQLERSMFLLSEVVGIKQPVVVLLNMIDVAKSQGREIDNRRLSELLGVPVLPFVASHGTGMDELYALLEKGNYQRYILQENALKKEYETQIGEVFTELEQKLKPFQTDTYTSVWLASKLLEGDKEITESIKNTAEGEAWNSIQNLLTQTTSSLLKSADCKFNWLHQIAKDVIVKQRETGTLLNKFDKVATSPFWGKIIAACVMVLSIYASYKLGYTLSNLSGIIYGYAYSAAYTGLSAISAPAFLIGFLCDAVLTGFFYAIMMTFFVLGAILIFGFIEEIGYMARIAYVFDNTMQKLGLHGKAIMPILMSFGCTIAGVNATRVLDSGKQKLLSIITSWVVPCSAVWGVITLMGSAFFGSNVVWVILLLFAVTLLHMKLTATLFGHAIIKPEDRAGLIMELPPYHRPNFKTLFKHVWLRVAGFLRRVIKLIVCITIIFWLLSYTPDGNITGSLIYKFGSAIEPFTMLFGLNWELFIAFLVSAIGKESALAVVMTLFEQHAAMGNIYNAAFMGIGVATTDVTANMLASVSIPQALAFMFAFFFNVPCYITVAATYAETHSLKWTVRIVAYYIASALLLAAIVYRIALLFF